jgi:hypothetical protein
MIQIIVTMIKTKLAFLQMKEEFLFAKAVEFLHATLGKRPKTFNTVDVIRADSELIISMIDAKMLLKTEGYQATITGPFIRVNDRLQPDFTSYYRLQRLLLAVGNYLGIDPAVPLENAEDDRLASSSASAFPSDPPAAKIRFVDLVFTALKRGVFRTFFNKTHSYFLKYLVYTFSRYPGYFRCFPGRQIHSKIPQDLTKFLLRNSGTAIIPVYLLHFSSLAPMKICLTTLEP